MSHPSSSWEQTFSELFDKGVEKYRQGHHQAKGLVQPGDAKFLRSIGYTEQEFFDFVEDFAKAGEPTLSTVLAIAAVRRDYFLQEQGGVFATRSIALADLPSKEAEVEGIAWLPRLIAKAEAKLRGEMGPDLMYGCGGDRKFFHARGVDPAEFLRRVWKAKGDSSAVISWVKESSAVPA